MEKVMDYFKGFFAGLVGIMMAIINRWTSVQYGRNRKLYGNA